MRWGGRFRRGGKGWEAGVRSELICRWRLFFIIMLAKIFWICCFKSKEEAKSSSNESVDEPTKKLMSSSPSNGNENHLKPGESINSSSCHNVTREPSSQRHGIDMPELGVRTEVKSRQRYKSKNTPITFNIEDNRTA
mmetsp:Transcript_28755/g.51163  ORF Transcript_28755/g.51163 Transcript_28755/m.51163 type:complete len:137 (+) Transcript_28755:2076-2486(+)